MIYHFLAIAILSCPVVNRIDVSESVRHAEHYDDDIDLSTTVNLDLRFDYVNPTAILAHTHSPRELLGDYLKVKVVAEDGSTLYAKRTFAPRLKLGFREEKRIGCSFEFSEPLTLVLKTTEEDLYLGCATFTFTYDLTNTDDKWGFSAPIIYSEPIRACTKSK